MTKTQIQVLLIEDTPADVIFLREALAQDTLISFELTTVERLQTALEILQKTAFDIILLDLGLPDSQGLETFSHIHQFVLDTPKIILSGLTDEALALQAVQNGAQDYIVKGTAGFSAAARAIRYAIERQKAQIALRASEERFRAMIENGLDDISLLDANGTLLWESPSAIRNLGYPIDTFVGQNIFGIAHPDDQGWISDLYTKVLQTPGSREAGVFRLQHADGTWRWIEAIVTNMLDNPSVQAIVVNYRDITERKQAEETIRSLAKFPEENPNPVLRIGKDGQIIYANNTASHKWLAAWGVSLNDPLPEEWQALAVDAYQRNTKQALDIAIQDRVYAISIVPFPGEGYTNVYGQDVTESKHAEDKLRYQANLLANINDAVVAVDDQYRITNWNHAAEVIYGWRAEEALGRHGMEIIRTNYSAEQLQTQTEILIATGELHVESVNYRKDNELIWVETRSSMLREADGTFEGLVSVNRDITERKRIEEALKETSEQFQTLFEASPEAIMIIDPHGAWPILDCNAIGCAMNGYTRAELIGQSVDIFNMTRGKPAERSEYLESIRKTGVLRYEAYHQRKDGTVFPIEISTSLITMGGREVILGIDRDITERKQAEEKLHASETRYRLATLATRDVIWEWRPDTDQLTWAANAETVFGYRPEEIGPTDKWWDEHIHPADRERVISKLTAVFDGSESIWLDEYRFLLKDGTYANISDHGYVERDISGKAIRIIGAMSNITESKQAEEKLHASEERYRKLIENFPNGTVTVYDRDLRLSFVAGSELKQSNTQPQDFLGKKFQEIAPPETFAIAEPFLRAAFQGRDGTYETPYWGDQHYFVNVAPIYKADGQVDEIQVISQNITDRKRAEQALRESEALYRQAIEVAGAVPYYESYYDNGQKIKYDFIGEGIRQITGYGPEEFSAQVWNSLVEEVNLVDDLAGYTLDEGIQRVRSGEYPVWKCEHRIRARDGKTHWVFEAAVEMYDEHGVVYGSIGTYQDITERKQAENSLRESEQRYRALFDDMPVAIWEGDFSEVKKYLDSLKAQGVTNVRTYFATHSAAAIECANKVRILNVNNTAVRMFRANNKDELISDTYQGLSSGEQEYIHESLAAIAEGRTSQSWEGGDETMDGEAMEISLNWSVVPGYENDYSKVIVTNTDITERKQAEEKLRESEARFASIFHTNPTRVSITSFADGRFLDVNESFLASTGYSRAEVLGHTALEFNDWVVPQDRVRLRALLEAQGRIQNFETRLRRKSGEILDILISAELVELFGQRCILSVGLDITERKQAEKELRENAVDLALINHLNETINRRESLIALIRMLDREFKEQFNTIGAALYLLSEDGQTLNMPSISIPQELAAKIEKLIGGPIPSIQVPVRPGGLFHKLLNTPQGTITTDPREIQQWLAQFAETDSLPASLKPLIQKLIPQVYRLLNIKSVISLPLTLAGKTIGVLDVSSSHLLNAHDLERFQRIGGQLSAAILRHQDEQKLRESNERFEQLADNIEEVFWISDAVNEEEIYFSPAAEKIWGCSIEKLMQTPRAFIEHILPEDHTIVLRALEEQKNGQRTEIEYRVLHPDGSVRWIWDRAFPIFDEAGRVARLAGIAADITQHKQAEEELRESEERFRSLFDRMLDGVYRSSHSGKFLNVNPAMVRIFGYSSREEMLNVDIKNELYFAPDERGSHILDTGREETDIYRMRRKDGSEIWVEDHGSYVHDEDGEIRYHEGILRDITERKQAEEIMRARELLLYESQKIAQLGHYRFIFSTGFWESSDVLNEVLGIDQDYPTDINSWANLVHPAQRAEMLAYFTVHVIEKHNAFDREYQIIRNNDGQARWVHGLGRLEFDAAGNLIQMIGTIQDITERKQAEAGTRRHLGELEALYENGLAVGQLLETRKIGERIIQTFARHLSWHHVAIRLLEPERNEMRLIAFNQEGLNATEIIAAELLLNSTISKVGQGLSGWVVQTGQALRTGNVHDHPQYVTTYPNIQSGLYMPLKIGDTVIGVISVESDEPNAFTEQDERLLATLANQATIAFENARLYQSVQQELQERKRAETALRMSETHYRELADSITDIFFELDHQMRYSHWNKASELLTGVPAQEAIGKTMRDIFGESQEQTRIERIYKDILVNHLPRTFETVFMVNNQTRFFEVNAYPSSNGVAVVAKDVTERKRSEIIMQKRFELMEYAARHALEEIMEMTIAEVSNLTGSAFGFFHTMEADQSTPGLQVWSTDTLSLFNVPVSEGTHRSVEQAGVWADAVRQRRAIIHNDYASLSNKNDLPTGHAPLIRELVIPIIRNEKILAVLGIANKPQDYTQQDLEITERFVDYAWDITERKQMELALAEERNQLAERVEERTADLSQVNANLARALRVKDEFLANMSHELRTPLNAILGLSESLAEQTAGALNEKQLRYVSTVSESGHHLLSLINDILDLAKIDAGQITLDINKVDINSACKASLRMIVQLARKKNQEVLVDIDNDLNLMWADERRLKQMLVNLLGNAVKFTPEGGKLGLEAHGDQDANKVTFTVWDTGIGIKEADLLRLFQPFVQLDAGLARQASGTGLGLALVSQMARLHGGSTSVVSQPGAGSRFSITLPWEQALAIDAIEMLKITGKFKPIKFNKDHKPTILLIEDTEEVIMMLSDYLDLNGFKTVIARDGIEGFTQAQLTHPDLILMDIQMPRMDGFETTKKLRSEPEFKTTPIIALTALAMQHDRERCLAAGMDEYITKPVHLRALVKLIELFLSGKAEVKNP